MKKPVSGIAMGLIKNAGEEKYAVLSDILGDEMCIRDRNKPNKLYIIIPYT